MLVNRYHDPCVIRKVRETWGYLGNMSPHPIMFENETWPTSEALFQALRFRADHPVRAQIQACKNPMKAKMTAKAVIAEAVVVPTSDHDVNNMRMVLGLKLAQHPSVNLLLVATAHHPIVEDCTARQRGSGLFWGAALKDGAWVGKNMLGLLWMEIRAQTRVI